MEKLTIVPKFCCVTANFQVLPARNGVSAADLNHSKGRAAPGWTGTSNWPHLIMACCKCLKFLFFDLVEALFTGFYDQSLQPAAAHLRI